jgi:TM2 domain-containing membrane protein YozV
MNMERNTHSKLIGYLLWIVGFTGSHRFYFGKPISGTIWFFTLGLFGIGWLVDLFLIPSMDRKADLKYVPGPRDYSLAWLLLVFLGFFGAHRLYLGKWISGLTILACTALSAVGFWIFVIPAVVPVLFFLVDLWTLNGQVSEFNRRHVPAVLTPQAA